MESSASLPVVSCCMPTRNRRRFVAQSIHYFLRQDYPRKELLVIDDGEDRVEDLIPRQQAIRYVRVDRRLPLGAKRNMACELAAGELIAHWDDDDWMAPNRLSVQVAELTAYGADVCGTHELLCYRPDEGDAWLYRYPANERPWLAGGTLLYRREVWAAHRFAEINVGEDSAFVWRLPPDRLRAVPDPRFYVAVIHRGNTSAKNLADPRWLRQPLDVVSGLLDADRPFYVALRNGPGVPAPRQGRAASATEPVTVVASIDVASGYGSMAEYLVLGMSAAGAQVHVAPMNIDTTGLTPRLREIVSRSRRDLRGPTVFFSWPSPALRPFLGVSDLFINTMWESARLPAGWAEQLNRARAVIAPTRFVARVCRDSGVTVPVEVVPEGVDPDTYHLEERPARPAVTTLVVAAVDDRKHVLEGIAAWKLAFEGDADARLIIKATYDYGNYAPDDPRITYVNRPERTRGIAHWYREADVLLALGNEGFGLPMVEGMATGLPVIALDSEGQGDVCEEARDLVLPVTPVDWRPYHTATFGDGGLRGIPGVTDVAARLRWVATHRDEARDLGRAASAWALANRNVWRKGPLVLDVMERHMKPGRPLRRRRTMWATTWGTACGVAEYAAQLADHLPELRVVTRAPEVAGVRVLQVQHAPGIVEDDVLTRLVADARRADVPVVITEHAVTAPGRPWERGADALVALTAHGAAMLRDRVPGVRVEHIPCGCPTWFPARKRERGRVIGAFGFHYPHKGFGRLLDVLRGVRGAELRLFSHPRSAEYEAAWRRAASGLPVHREERFLPAYEIARRLAAEADVLVFWYDEATHAAASAAVRIGLATGVPVLTSPTSWFRDVRSATHQPSDLAAGVQRLLEDTPLREELAAAARDYCNEHSWPRIAERHMTLWRSLERS